LSYFTDSVSSTGHPVGVDGSHGCNETERFVQKRALPIRPAPALPSSSLTRPKRPRSRLIETSSEFMAQQARGNAHFRHDLALSTCFDGRIGIE
jgi:hypothetical protein